MKHKPNARIRRRRTFSFALAVLTVFFVPLLFLEKGKAAPKKANYLPVSPLFLQTDGRLVLQPELLARCKAIRVNRESYAKKLTKLDLRKLMSFRLAIDPENLGAAPRMDIRLAEKPVSLSLLTRNEAQGTFEVTPTVKDIWLNGQKYEGITRNLPLDSLAEVNLFLNGKDSIGTLLLYTRHYLREKTQADRESSPGYNGGDIQAFGQWIRDHLRYPAGMAEKDIQGPVIVSLELNKKGEILKYEILKSPHPALSVEVLRVLQEAPNLWDMSQVKKETIRVTCPISFRLQQNAPRRPSSSGRPNYRLP